MDLIHHYQNLWDSAYADFQNNRFTTDPLIDDTEDNRYGLTLRALPSKEVKLRIREFLHQVRGAAPEQYYYPETDIHITILTLISCQPGFTLNQINLPEYHGVLAEALQDTAPISIHFRGITASSSSVMIQGFPVSEGLNEIREKFRSAFHSTGLYQTIDKRYKIQTAHSTVIRFRTQPQQPDQLLQVLQKYRDFDFGSTDISQLDLVGNDWYHRTDNVRKLYAFKL